MKYIFLGIVHPERAILTISDIRGEIVSDDNSFQGIINVSIKLSHIVAELETDVDLTTVDLKNTVENFVHTIVDVYGYLKGYAYTVEIYSVYIPEIGKDEVFGIDVAKITLDEKNRPLGYQDTLHLTLKTPELNMAMKDLRDAIKRPLDTFFHCRRATETITQYFTKSGNKAKGWKETIRVLGLNEGDIEEIKKLGGGQRHGIFESVTGQRRVDILMKTWHIVDKFIEYLKSQDAMS